MTGNASCQQFGVDAMMSSSCFVSSNMVDAEAATMVHVPEYMPHDGSLGLVGDFLADDGALLAGQLQLVRPAAPQSVSSEEAHGAYSVASGYGPSPSDVTVALQPTAAMLAGEPDSSWILQEQYHCRGLFQPPYCRSGGDELGRARPGRPHFSQVLSRSGYAHIVQQTLDEFTGCLLQDVAGATGSVVAEAHCPLPSSSSSITTPSNQSMFANSEEHAHQKLRNDLLKLLQLTDQRCNQCLDEMQSAASKYGSMVRPEGGALSAPFVHSALSAMRRRLRARIIGATTQTQRGREHASSVSLADRERSWESAFIEKHWALRQLRRGDQQSWRPQRGLPEKSVAVLKAWMFENFLRPYPKDSEKEMLAARSGLSRSQVSNWFINARVRLWKPMIEEMYEDLKKASVDSEGVPL